MKSLLVDLICGLMVAVPVASGVLLLRWKKLNRLVAVLALSGVHYGVFMSAYYFAHPYGSWPYRPKTPNVETVSRDVSSFLSLPLTKIVLDKAERDRAGSPLAIVLFWMPTNSLIWGAVLFSLFASLSRLRRGYDVEK